MMKLSNLIREYIDLKIEGEPNNNWISIDENSNQRREYHNSLTLLEEDMDNLIQRVLNNTTPAR